MMMKGLLFLFIFLLLTVKADVTLDYPGWVIFGEEKGYPGIPSTSIN